MGIIMKNKVCYSNGGNTTIQPVIYSDTEREIGVWRDGKPLYQKTIYIDDIGTGSPTEVSLAGLDIDTAIDIQAQVTYTSNTGKWHLLPYIEPGSPNSSIGLRIELNTTPQRLYLIPGSDYASDSQWYMNHFLATIQYTKTTDTAGSGTWTPQGVPAVHYSTDEQVIGTWIDGKTLYQKTYYYTHNDTISGGFTTIGTISDYEYLQFVNCMYYTTDGRCYSIPYANGSSTTVPYLENGNIQLRVSSDTWGPEWGVVITVQYTKATD